MFSIPTPLLEGLCGYIKKCLLMNVRVILYFPHLRVKMRIEQGKIFIPEGDDFAKELRNIAAIEGRWLGSGQFLSGDLHIRRIDVNANVHSSQSLRCDSCCSRSDKWIKDNISGLGRHEY